MKVTFMRPLPLERTLSAFAAALLVSCGGASGDVVSPARSTPPAAEVVAVAPSTAAVDGEIGELHRSRCGKCHLRVEPKTRARPALSAALLRHRSRVHLSEAQWGALLDYLAPPG